MSTQLKEIKFTITQRQLEACAIGSNFAFVLARMLCGLGIPASVDDTQPEMPINVEHGHLHWVYLEDERIYRFTWTHEVRA